MPGYDEAIKELQDSVTKKEKDKDGVIEQDTVWSNSIHEVC